MSKFWIKMGTESKGAFSFKKQKRKRQRKTEELHGEGERGWMGQRGFHGEGERVWRGQGSSWRRSDRLEVLCHCPGVSEFRRGRKTYLLAAFRSHDLPGE